MGYQQDLQPGGATRQRVRRALSAVATFAAAGALAFTAVVPASATVPGVSYGGNMTQGAALTHLMGAYPSDPIVVERALAHTATAVTFHVRVNQLNSDLTRYGWFRYQNLYLEVSTGSGSAFKEIQVIGEAPVSPYEQGPNSDQINCSTQGAKVGAFPGGVAASTRTNTYVISISMNDFLQCGFKRGQRVSIYGSSGMAVNNDPEAAGTRGRRSGSWVANGAGVWVTFTL